MTFVRITIPCTALNNKDVVTSTDNCETVATLSALAEINISAEDFQEHGFENNKSRIVEVKSVV